MSKLTEWQKVKIVAEIFPKGSTKTEILSSAKAEIDRLNRCISSLNAQLIEISVARNDLYAANQKFAEDDHEYRLAAVKAQNQLTNDNLHMSDEIARLKQANETLYSTAKMVESDTLDDLFKRDREISALKSELAEWIANPVNKQLDEQVNHLTEQNRTLFIQADELQNQRNQLLEANAGLARDIDRQDKVIKQLRGTVNSFKAAFVEEREQSEKIRSAALNTNAICNAELAKEKGKHDIRLVGAKQRIAELEAALNYFNGLCQQGAPDLAANWRVKVANLEAVLEQKDILIRKHEGQISHLNFLLDSKVAANFELSEKLSEFTNRPKSLFTKLCSFLTKIR